MKSTHSSQPHRCLAVLLIVVVFLSFGQPQPTQAAITTHLYVDTTNDDAALKACEPGVTDCSLRGAIQHVNETAGTNPFMIHLLDTTYNLTHSGGDDTNILGDLDVSSGNNLIIDGAGIDLTVINGMGNNDRIIDHQGEGILELSDLTVQNGFLASNMGGGGGIRSLSTGELTLDNVRIAGNYVAGVIAGDAGGGIFVSDADLTIQGGTQIEDNSACHGGGIMVNNSVHFNVYIESSDIIGNRARCEMGGGILFANNVTGDINQTTVSGNHAKRGAGYIQSSTTTAIINGMNVYGNVIDAGGTGVAGMELNGEATVSWSQIYNNTGSTGAGGIELMDNSEVIIEDSAIRSNDGDDGGGIRIEGNTSASLRRVEISDNDAITGGGISVRANGNVYLENVTIAENYALDYGGGIYLNLNDSAEFDHITVANNLGDSAGDAVYIAHNSRWNTRNSIYSSGTGTEICAYGGLYILMNGGHNLTPDSSCNLTHATDILGYDPMLAGLDFYSWKLKTMALLPGSRAIDAALAGDPVTTDGRTKSRVDGDLDGIIESDIGAHEYYLEFYLPLIIKP